MAAAEILGSPGNRLQRLWDAPRKTTHDKNVCHSDPGNELMKGWDETPLSVSDRKEASTARGAEKGTVGVSRVTSNSQVTSNNRVTSDSRVTSDRRVISESVAYGALGSINARSLQNVASSTAAENGKTMFSNRRVPVGDSNGTKVSRMRTTDKDDDGDDDDSFVSGRYQPGSLGTTAANNKRSSEVIDKGSQRTDRVAGGGSAAPVVQKEVKIHQIKPQTVEVEHDPKRQQAIFLFMTGIMKSPSFYPFDLQCRLRVMPTGAPLAALRDDQGMNLMHIAVETLRPELFKMLFYHGSWPELSRATVDRGSSSGSESVFHGCTALEMVKKLVSKPKGPVMLNEFYNYNSIMTSIPDLSLACLKGNQDDVERLLAKSKANGIHRLDTSGSNCLTYAAAGGSLSLVERLASLGVSPEVTNDRGETALHLAAELGRTEVIHYLIRQCQIDPGVADNKGQRTVDLVALNGDVDMMEALVASGVEPDARCVAIATKQHRVEMVKYLMDIRRLEVTGRDPKGRTGFLNACANGFLDLVTYFLSHGASLADEDNHGRNCFHLAAENGKTEIVEYLLKGNEGSHHLKQLLNARDKYSGQETVQLIRGRDRNRAAWDYIQVKRHLVNAFTQQMKTGSIDWRDFGSSLRSGYGEAPSAEDRNEIEKQSLKRLKTSADRDMTPLHLAVFHRAPEVTTTRLLEFGANPDARDKFGQTPLHLAAMRGTIETVKLLEKWDASFDITDAEGTLAVDVANRNGHVAVENNIRGKATQQQGKTIQELLQKRLGELSEQKMEALRQNGDDARRHLVAILRDMMIDIKIALQDLGSGPVVEESNETDAPGSDVTAEEAATRVLGGSVSPSDA